MIEKVNKVHGGYAKRYAPETPRILAEARQTYLEQKSQGYDRKQAFRDLRQAQDEITAYLLQSVALQFSRKTAVERS